MLEVLNHMDISTHSFMKGSVMSDRFDEIAKAMASGVSRRRFLKILAGGTAASIAAITPAAKEAGATYWGHSDCDVNQVYDLNQSYEDCDNNSYPNQGGPVWWMPPGHYQPGQSHSSLLGGWPVYVPQRKEKSSRRGWN